MNIKTDAKHCCKDAARNRGFFLECVRRVFIEWNIVGKIIALVVWMTSGEGIVEKRLVRRGLTSPFPPFLCPTHANNAGFSLFKK